MIQDAYLKYNPYVPFLPETEITFLCFACAFMAGIWLRGWYLCVRCHHFHPAHGLCTSDWFFLAWKKSMFWIFARFLCTKSFLQKKYPNGFSGKPCNPTFRWGTLLSPFQCYSAPGIRWSFLGGFKQGAAPFDWLLFVGEVGSPFFFSIDCSLYIQSCFFWEDSWKENLFLGTKWFRNVMTSESNMKRSVNRQQMHVYVFQFLRTCPRKDWRGGRRFRDGALTPESRGAVLKIELRWLDFVTAITLMGFKRESIQICYLSWRSMSNWSSVNSNSVMIVQRSGGVGMIGTLHCCRCALPRLAHSFRRWWDCWDTIVRWLKGCDGIGPRSFHVISGANLKRGNPWMVQVFMAI